MHGVVAFFASLHEKIRAFRKNILGIYRFLIFEFEILRSLFFRFLVEVICRKDRSIVQIYLDQSGIYFLKSPFLKRRLCEQNQRNQKKNQNQNAMNLHSTQLILN